ncbi:MAG: PAS domain S-box protein [Anaerolineae bacterium]|nr:PAS domain S-box protein [Anaerolineae bacterium]
MKNMTWSIGHKLVVGFATVVILTIAGNMIGFFALNRVNNEVETTTTVSARLETLSNLITISLLEARRSETAFFLRYPAIGIGEAEAEYVSRVQDQVAAIHTYADEGISLETGEADRMRFRQIKTLIDDHEAAFLQAVALVEQRGHVDTGLEGQFRAKIHQMEQAVAGAKLDQLTIDILSIRRNEKDYLLRGNSEDIDQVAQLIGRFKQHLAATHLNAADQARLNTLADEYLALFQQLTQVDRDLAAAIDGYREQADSIEPLVAEIRADASADFQQSVQTSNQTIGTATILEIGDLLLAVFLGFGIAVALSRSISRPVQALTEAATIIAGGDLTHQAQVTSRDEIGVLANAFNQMVVNLRDLIEQVRESEERYRRLVELSFDAIIIYVEGKLVYVNPRGVHLAGAASPDQLLGKPILDFVHPDSFDVAQLRLQQLEQGSGVPLLEEKFMRLDGASIEVESAAVPITYQGHPAVQTVIRDITERKRAQAVQAQLAAIVESSNDAIIGKTLEGIIMNWNRGAEDLYGYSAEEVKGRSVALLVPPDRPNELSKILEKLKQGQRIEQYETVRVRKDGRHIDVAVTISPIKDGNGKITGASTIAQDITERKARASALEQRVEERTREFATLLEVAHNLASTLDMERLLGLILDQLKIVVDCFGATIYKAEGEALIALAHRGPIPQQAISELRFWMRQAGAFQQVIVQQTPVIIPDIQDETPLALLFRESVGERLETAFAYVRSWLGVPLMIKEQVIGMLGLHHDQPNYYTARHAKLAIAFANQAAIAIENARLYEQAQELATFQERQRLAHDLHDAVSQSLFSASLAAEVLPRLWERHPEEGRRCLTELHRLTRSALAEMRTLLLELRPTALVETALADLLNQLAEAVASRAMLEVSLTIEFRDPLPPEVQLALYRIAQEALNNVAKHAGASHVGVKLQSIPFSTNGEALQNGIELRITDDGRGFDLDHIPPARLGLSIMRERAETIGAILKLKSQSEQGTEVIVIWPGMSEAVPLASLPYGLAELAS